MLTSGFDNLPQTSPASLAWAHPLVQEWFAGRFGSPTEPQEQGWPPILAGKSTLICAPTGSGKTLAAFLACIDYLIRKALSGGLQDRTEVLYVSPLKALSNDIRKNLEVPLSEISALASQRGLLMPPIRAAVRTGDTLTPERREMLARPPHILVTTPESLYILLTAEKSRAILRHVETVIVDEIHAVADDKRGAHLALSLERLEALIAQSRPSRPPVRIGLSATQKPIELVAKFLVGNDRAEPVIINIGHRRALDLAVEVPRSELGPIASNEMWEEVYDRLAELVRQYRSTLVFVNTRRLSERVSHHLAQRLGADAVAAHHGSLARKVRLEAESKLKSGQVRVLVATASLELGIDIGTVDLVCQIQSPHSIAVALQRIGRAGHWRGAVPKGRLFAMTRDELIECAALVRALRQGELDQLEIPDSPLDILAQQIVAMCACEEWNEDDLFQVVRRAYPYRNLARQDFDALLEILSEGITARRGRYGSYLHRDRVRHRLRGRRGSRMVAITNGGAIPESALYTVVAQPEGLMVGTVAEDFAVESMGGDVFLLGNTSWRIRRVEGSSGRVLVEDAHGAAPNIPFWLGEAPARTPELSAQVSEIREKVSVLATPPEAGGHETARSALECGSEAAALISHEKAVADATALQGAFGTTLASAGALPPKNKAAASWLKEQCGLDDAGAEQAVEYILGGRAVLGAVPTQNRVVAERFFDEAGGMQLIIHAPFGARINKAWGLALRKRFCRSFNFELQAAATEDGLNISLGEQHSFPLADVFHFLSVESAAAVLEQAALVSPIFATRWRWDATRALALPRFRNGKKIPLQIQRMRADDLLAAVFPDAAACQDNLEGDIRVPDHPLVREVMKDVLTEALDLEGLKRVLRAISDGSIRCIAVDTPAPSPFSHEILNANPYAYLDDAPLEERRARAVSLRRALPETVLSEIGRLDPAAIAQVREEAWPDVRDADELNEALQVFVALPENFVPPGGASLAQALMPVDGNHSREITTQARAPVPPVAAQWGDLFRQLVAEKRATRAVVACCHSEPVRFAQGKLREESRSESRIFWVAVEKIKAFSVLFPGARFETQPAEIDESVSTRDDALLQLVRGWMEHSGPVEVPWLARAVGLPAADIEAAMLRLESEGRVLRGQFTGSVPLRSDHGKEPEPVMLSPSPVTPSGPPVTASPSPVTPSGSPVTASPSPVIPSSSAVILSEAKNLRSSSQDAKTTTEILLPRLRDQNDRRGAQDDTPGGIKGWCEWCDRRLLARIHRLTLGTLRREIQPVTRTQFMRWLLRWQHLAPGTQVNAERGLLEVLRQLQGFEAPANAWEPHILAPRVAGYDPQILDQLCLTGAVGWGRLSPHPAMLEPSEGSAAPLSGNLTKACHSDPERREGEEPRSVLLPDQHFSAARQSEIPRCARNDMPGVAARRITPSSVAPITFFVREESDWMIARHASLAAASRALSHVAREVLEFIRQRGASFFADIVRGTGQLKSEVEMALWELVAAGLFTADGFDNLRALIDPKRRAGQGRGRKARPRHSTGRWSLLFSGEPTDRAKALESVCHVLLERYGVVFRELTLREELPFKWRELLIAFRRLEDRGEVRGGRFVDGFLGEQFALPVALESLRAARHADVGAVAAATDAPLQPEIVTLSAADPLNLVGIIVPGERVPAISGKAITLRDGTPIVEQPYAAGALGHGPSTDVPPL
jgi:ATP-dependent Lhr-like helicase